MPFAALRGIGEAIVRGGVIVDILLFVVVMAAWLLLQTWLLPKLGVPT